MTSHRAKHAQSLDTVATVVAEYAPATKVETFAFSPQPFRSRASTKESLLRAAAAQGDGPGAVLLLNDPAGMAADIAAALAEQQARHMAHGDDARRLSSSTAILALKSAVTDRSELIEIDAGDQLEQDGHYVPDGLGRMQYVANPPTLPDTTSAGLDRVSTGAWNKYLGDYRETERADWHKKFLADYDAWQTRVLIPLAKSHAAWMSSAQMFHYFDCTHDDASPDVGLVYTRVLTRCIQGTEEHAPCSDLYVQWLDGMFDDDHNLLLRAIALNLNTNRQKFVQGLQGNIAWKTIGWDNLIGAFNNSIDTVKQHVPDVLGKFLVAIGGSLTQALQKGAASEHALHAAVALGVVSNRPVIPVRLEGSYKGYREALIKQLLRASGIKNVNSNAMQREVSLALRRLQIRGEPMTTPVASSFLVLIDEQPLKDMPPGLDRSQKAEWLARTIKTPEQIEIMNMDAWRERMNTPVAASKVAKVVPFVGNAAAALFQLAAFSKVSGDLAKAMQGDKSEQKSRLFGAVVAIASTGADTLSRTAALLAERTLVAGRAVFLNVAERILGVVAKGAGIIAGVIGAWWDATNVMPAIKEGRIGLAAAFGASAFAGIVTVIALTAGWVIVAIVALAVYFAAAIVISLLQPDDINKWLRRCYWGKGDVYGNEELEISELKVATGS